MSTELAPIKPDSKLKDLETGKLLGSKVRESSGVDDGLLDDPEEPNINTGLTTGPDLNAYQQKKTLAQGMMDLALLSANANQLRYVLETGSKHSYYYTNLVLISLSLILQILVGIGLIWNSRYNVHKNKHLVMANRVNNLTIIGVFVVTVLNVFISAFGIPGVSEVSPLTDLVVRP